MSAEAKPTATPPPVFARPHPKPQYLAPGQHLKVASRKPPTKTVPAANPIPRDPWEAYDAEEDSRGGSGEFAHHESGKTSETHTRAAPPPPPARSAAGSNSFSGGSSGGHPFSSHLSRSRSRVNSEASASGDGAAAEEPKRQPDANGCLSDVKDNAVPPPPPPLPPTAAQAEAEEEDEGDYYHTAEEGPTLSAAERAQRVLEMQHEALEAKQLRALTDQGIARRPKTLVRNRHGRLQAITAAPSEATAPTTESALRIADAPVMMKRKPRRAAQPVKAVAPVTEVDLVDSRPSTPIERRPERLEIDLD